jgi:hypothetical protein
MRLKVILCCFKKNKSLYLVKGIAKMIYGQNNLSQVSLDMSPKHSM